MMVLAVVARLSYMGGLASLLAFGWACLSAVAGSSPKIHFDIDSLPAKDGLLEFARQANLDLVMNPRSVTGLRTQALSGDFDVDEGLSRLLGRSGISVNLDLSQSQLEVIPPEPGKPQRPVTVPREEGDVHIDSVVITGSRLKVRKAADSAAQRVYDQHALEQSGAATLAEVLGLIPENFNSVTPTSSMFGNTVGPSQMGNNLYLGAGFNLSGLGPEATLTLLDGDRLVSGGASGTFFDLSMLPMNAVESIVTLIGDTSAVYGSDAIAGVANILLRPGSDGSETRVRYGATTGGRGGLWVFSQRLGGSWQAGGGMIAYQGTQQRPVPSTVGSYIPSVNSTIDIIPQQRSSVVLGTLDYQLTQDTSAKVHVLYGTRDVIDDSGGFRGYQLRRDALVTEYGGTVHIDHRITSEWTVGVYGSYSKLMQSLATSALGALQNQVGNGSLGEFALSANAEPIMVYGHTVRLAFGGGGREETLTVPTSVYHTTHTSLARKVGNFYLETLLPLVTGSHTFLKRLELSLAAREDYYETVGPTLNPKAGLVWSPVSELSLRSTFARSFRPPTLDELAPIPFYYTVNVPDPASHTGGVIDTLVDQSQGISRLKPETARTITGGLDYGRGQSQGWSGSLTWFRTLFDNRIATPIRGSVDPTTNLFNQPALAPYIGRSFTLSEIQAIFANPAFGPDSAKAGAEGVRAKFNNEPTNIVRTIEEGLAASVRYSDGHLGAFAIANYLLGDTYRFAPGAPGMSLTNNIGQTPRKRARGGVTGSWSDWGVALSVNYTNSYRNTLVSPAQGVDAWTTVDFQLGWKLPVATVPDVRLTLNARNLLNTGPPWVRVPPKPPLRPVGFDATNASPFGRMLSLELSVAWH